MAQRHEIQVTFYSCSPVIQENISFLSFQHCKLEITRFLPHTITICTEKMAPIPRNIHESFARYSPKHVTEVVTYLVVPLNDCSIRNFDCLNGILCAATLCFKTHKCIIAAWIFFCCIVNLLPACHFISNVLWSVKHCLML